MLNWEWWKYAYRLGISIVIGMTLGGVVVPTEVGTSPKRTFEVDLEGGTGQFRYPPGRPSYQAAEMNAAGRLP